MPKPSYERTKPAPVVESRKERLAVNLFDLSLVHPTIRQMVLAGKLDVKNAIWVDKERMDETAVAFTCDLLSAATACDVLRLETKRDKGPPIRVYIKRAEVWSRLPHVATLTKIENGVAVLSPEWFPQKVELIPIAPLPVEKFDWGKFK